MERVKCKQLFAQLESLTGEQFTALLATMRLRQDLGGIVPPQVMVCTSEQQSCPHYTANTEERS